MGDLLKVNGYVNNFANLTFFSSFYPIITKPTKITETNRDPRKKEIANNQ